MNLTWFDGLFRSSRMLWLLLILVLPLIGFLCWQWRKRQQLITQFISSRLLANLKVGVSPGLQKARLGMIVAAVVAIVLALARPYWGTSLEEVRQRGLDIIMAVDTSNSMLAEDVAPSRLARAKLAALDLMRRARTERLGLIAFAGDAFLECPLTLDDAAFSQSVNALDTKTISQGGTAIAEAINEARAAFKNESDNHKVLVLFTDGEDHDSDVIPAAKEAAKEGVVIFTVGIGSAEGEKLRIHDAQGHVEYIRDEQGQPVVSHLNEELLQQIATIARGFYLPLRGANTMDMLYDKGLAPLPKSEGATKLFKGYHERFRWPLTLAIILLITEMFISERKRRSSKSPASRLRAEETAALPSVLPLLLLLALPASLQASPASALKEYNAGEYQEALKDYNQLLENKKDDPRLHFNAGTAAYQSHQLDAAAKEFSDALSSPDLQLQERAYYNLGNTQYRAGQQLADADKKKEAWENALKGYSSALKLNPQDADAKFNQQFVTRQLEELKKQQQQQQKQQPKQQNKSDKNQDKKDQPKQDQNNQSGDKNQDQQKEQSSNDQKKSEPDKSESQKNSQAGQDQQKSDAEKQKEEKQNAEKKPEDGSEPKPNAEPQSANGEPKEKSAEEAKREAAMMAAGQMTPRQAQQLLDSHKDDEKVFQIPPPNKQTAPSRNFKNW